jgi:uncharacterized protein
MFNVFIWFALVFVPAAYGFAVPLNDGFVTDQVGIINQVQKQGIESNLLQYQTVTSNEIAVLIVGSLDGESEADVAVDVMREWGIGSAQNDNGILILHAYEDRTVYIGVGYGLEGALPDLIIDGILRTDIIPAFQAGDYVRGYTQAIDALQKHIGDEYTADRYDEPGSSFDFLLFILFILLNPIAALLGRTKSWWLGGVFGCIGGSILALLYSWWLSIPLLLVIGLLFDYIVSKAGTTGSSNRYRGFSSGYTRSPYKRSSSTFRGFGGGRSGGGGAGRRY